MDAYGPVRMEAACKRGLRGNKFSYGLIKKILENNIDLLEEDTAAEYRIPAHNTVEQLKPLKLTGMAKRYEAALLLPVHELQDVHALVGMIKQAEVEYRDHARTQKYLKASKLRYHAAPEDILCNPERGITREQVLRLSDGYSLKKVKMYSLRVLQDVENPFSPLLWDAVPVCWATVRSTSA